MTSKPQRIDRAAVAGAFDAHAAVYDRMIGVDRAYHEQLRISARRMGLPDRGAGLRLLDIGCGTGASTAALLDAAPEAEIVAVDASERMLAQARSKMWPPGVRFVRGDVDDLEAAGVTGPFDGVMAAFLLRNTSDTNAVLRALRTLLRPGAPMAVHEYSVRDSLRSRMLWTSVCWGVIIPLGRLRAPSTDLYRYLWRSVLDFDGVEALTTRLRATGFVDVRVQTMPGWQQHIVHTFLGRRPGGPLEPAASAESTRPADVPVTAAAEDTPAGAPAGAGAAGAGAAADDEPEGFGNDAPTPPSGSELTKPE